MRNGRTGGTNAQRGTVISMGATFVGRRRQDEARSQTSCCRKPLVGESLTTTYLRLLLFSLDHVSITHACCPHQQNSPRRHVNQRLAQDHPVGEAVESGPATMAPSRPCDARPSLAEVPAHAKRGGDNRTTRSWRQAARVAAPVPNRLPAPRQPQACPVSALTCHRSCRTPAQ